MATALDNIKIELNALATAQLSGLSLALAQAEIDNYCAAREAVEDLASNKVSSYSIAGRSVTRRDISAVEQQAARSWSRLQSMLDGLPDITEGRAIGIDHTSGRCYA